jgi:hypothetical protein
MRRIWSVLAGVTGVVFMSAAVGASVAAGGNTVQVSATVPLTYAIDVSTGAVYKVTATGFATTAMIPRFHVPGVSMSASGPAGQPNQPCLPAYENDVNGHCTVAYANFGELVGVVMDDNGFALATVEIGASPTFTAPADGHLFLAVNDLNLAYWDNNGQFGVLITPQ